MFAHSGMFIQHLPLLPLPAPDPYYIHSSSSSFPTLKLCCGGFLTILLQRSNKPRRNHFSSRACTCTGPSQISCPLHFATLPSPSMVQESSKLIKFPLKIVLRVVCAERVPQETNQLNQSLDQNVARFSTHSEATWRGRREEGGGEREVDNAYRFWSRTDAVETDRRPLKFLSNFRGEILQNHRRGNSHFSHLPESRDTRYSFLRSINVRVCEAREHFKIKHRKCNLFHRCLDENQI